MNKASDVLKTPFPYAGGKAKVADAVWSRFGNVDNYIEPFAGSLAVLIRRPAEHFRDGYRVETCNDLNHYIVNFWRAVKAEPERVAEFADSPVLEADLHARHKWLVRSQEAVEWRERMRTDPEAFDAKIAGWWCWGACCWIGGAWCAHKVDQNNMPSLDASQKGVHAARGENPSDWKQIPDLDPGRGNAASGVDGSHKEKMPNLGQECATGGVGVNGVGPVEWLQRPNMEPADHGVLGRPQLCDAFDIGRGVNAGGSEMHRKRPNFPEGGIGLGVLGGYTVGTCDARRAWLIDWMRRLSDRLRLVRTCYGHWSRICDSDSTLTRLGTTGVFLDPPYPAINTNGKKSRDPNLYATDKGADLNKLRDEVLAWCRKWGSDQNIRVAVCGYEGDGYEPLTAEGWTVQAWEANGGYANQRRKGKGKSVNAKRERIWYSPHCVAVSRGLFDDYEPDAEAT